MAFTPEAQAEILTIVQDEVGKLGTVLLHGQLPTDPPGQPSRIGLDQIAAKIDALPTSGGSDPALVAAVTELSDLLKSGTLALVATLPPEPAPGPGMLVPPVADSIAPIDLPGSPMITQVATATEGAS